MTGPGIGEGSALPGLDVAGDQVPTKSVTIHQSYFLPWLGFFNKLAQVQTFVVLDDVQFRKRHYFDRTKIIDMHGEVRWLSLRVGEQYRKLCTDVTVPTSSIDPIISTIRHSYAKAVHFEEGFGAISDIIRDSATGERDLVAVNVGIIIRLLQLLGLPSPRIRYSSELADSADPTTRIIQICRAIAADVLLIGAGSSAKVHDLTRIRAAGISTVIQDYLAQQPAYSQSRRRELPFVRGISVIDAILNVGVAQTRDMITVSL